MEETVIEVLKRSGWRWMGHVEGGRKVVVPVKTARNLIVNSTCEQGKFRCKDMVKKESNKIGQMQRILKMGISGS